MRRNDNAGNAGYRYEENVRRAAERCIKYYIDNTERSMELLRIRCEYYQVDYNDVIREIKSMI